jgi:MarR family transcriptional regulator, transcriptional regulator for hemolysin
MHRQAKTSHRDGQRNSVRLIGHAHRVFARLVDAPLRKLGFAMSQLPVLVALKQGKPMAQSELARLAAVEQSSMAQLLNRMERDGLVKRVADPNDKRSRLISLTETASRRMPKGKVIMDAAVDIALQGFSPAEVERLGELIARIKDNLERAADDGEY